MEDAHRIHELIKSRDGEVTVGDLVEIALGVLSPAARCLIYAWLEDRRSNRSRAAHFIKLAKEKAASMDEMAYILHFEATLLFHKGDLLEAVEKEKDCLAICSGMGNLLLKADTLSLLSALYRTLGLDDLAQAYKEEAAAAFPDSALDAKNDKG